MNWRYTDPPDLTKLFNYLPLNQDFDTIPVLRRLCLLDYPLEYDTSSRNGFVYDARNPMTNEEKSVEIRFFYGKNWSVLCRVPIGFKHRVPTGFLHALHTTLSVRPADVSFREGLGSIDSLAEALKEKWLNLIPVKDRRIQLHASYVSVFFEPNEVMVEDVPDKVPDPESVEEVIDKAFIALRDYSDSEQVRRELFVPPVDEDDPALWRIEEAQAEQMRRLMLATASPESSARDGSSAPTTPSSACSSAQTTPSRTFSSAYGTPSSAGSSKYGTPSSAGSSAQRTSSGAGSSDPVTPPQRARMSGRRLLNFGRRLSQHGLSFAF